MAGSHGVLREIDLPPGLLRRGLDPTPGDPVAVVQKLLHIRLAHPPGAPAAAASGESA